MPYFNPSVLYIMFINTPVTKYSLLYSFKMLCAFIHSKFPSRFVQNCNLLMQCSFTALKRSYANSGKCGFYENDSCDIIYLGSTLVEII